MPFAYIAFKDPIAEIRFLTIEPGSGQSPLVCSLHHWQLDHPFRPQYEAVSYCWGDHTRCRTIKLNDHTFEITSNAFGALHNFRRVGKARVLWIDTLCIDQSNDEEKERQISLMGRIYRESVRTLAWLGEDDGSVSEASVILGEVVQDMAKNTNDFDRPTLQAVMWPSSGLAVLQAWPSPIHLQPLLPLFERSWFTRSWVVQEILLAPETICVSGEHEMKWDSLAKAAAWLPHKIGWRDVSYKQHHNIVLTGSLWVRLDYRSGRPVGPWDEDEETHPSLGAAMAATADFDVTDPKDRIYSIFGLLKWSQKGMSYPERLLPNYSKPLFDVYRDAIKVDIEDTGTLRILGRGLAGMEGSFRPDSTAPTWVARWDLRFDDVIYEGHTTALPMLRPSFRASSERVELLPAWHERPDSLVLRGRVADNIILSSPLITWSDFRDATATRRLITSLWHIASSSQRYTERERAEAFRLTLVARLPEDRGIDKATDLLGRYDGFLRHLALVSPIPISSLDVPIWPSSIGDYEEFKAGMKRVLEHRRFFVTSTGYFGIGSQHLQEDDLVCVLQGGSMPYVLRPKESHYLFLHECYVGGMMTGELDEDLNTVFDIR